MASQFFLEFAVSQDQPITDPVIYRGTTLWQEGRQEEAVEYLEKALVSASNKTDIMRLLGQFQAERGNWGQSKNWMSEVLDQNPKDTAALYYLGICYRETGKFKAFILRSIDWNKSRRFFERAIALNPFFLDVFFQYAILQRYREKYFSAIELAERQLEHNARLEKVQVDIFHLYDIFLHHENPKKVRDWLSIRGGVRQQYFIGESYRRVEEFDRADSIFQNLLSVSDLKMSRIPVYLSLIRLNIQRDQLRSAESYFNRAVENIRDEADAALVFEDVKYVFADEELENYEKIRSIEGKKLFFQTFWVRRNPLPAAETNVRLVEHYRRMPYSEEYYRYDGLRSWFNNPDKLKYLTFPKVFYLNDKFNDKGLVYLRHGPPDDKAFHIDEAAEPNESWLYLSRGSDRKLMFHFFLDTDAVENNWRLGAILPPRLLESRLHWDTIFQRMMMANSQLEYFQYETELGTMSREDVRVGMDTDRHSWREEFVPIDFSFDVSTFRGKNNLTRYDIYYALDPRVIWPGDKDVPVERSITVGFSVHDLQWNELIKRQREISISEISSIADTMDYWPDRFTFEEIPRDYQLSIYARENVGKKLGGYRFKYASRGYGGKKLMMSDIVLARSISPIDTLTVFSKHGLNVIPNPSHAFRTDTPVFVYFELYNLPVLRNESLQFFLQYKVRLLKKYKDNIFSKFIGLFSKDRVETSNKIERYNDTDFSVEYLALDLTRKTPGRYELEIIASFPTTGETMSRKVEFGLE